LPQGKLNSHLPLPLLLLPPYLIQTDPFSPQRLPGIAHINLSQNFYSKYLHLSSIRIFSICPTETE